MRRPSPGDGGSGSGGRAASRTPLLSQIPLVLRRWPWWNQRSGSTGSWLHDGGEGRSGRQHPPGGASASSCSSHLTAVGPGHLEHPLLMLPGGQVFPSGCYIETLPRYGSWRQQSLVLVVTGVCTHQRRHAPRGTVPTHTARCGGPRPRRPSAGPHWLSYSNSSDNS